MIAAESGVEGEVVFCTECTGSGEKMAMRLCLGYKFNFVVAGVLRPSISV